MLRKAGRTCFCPSDHARIIIEALDRDEQAHYAQVRGAKAAVDDLVNAGLPDAGRRPRTGQGLAEAERAALR